MIAQNTLKRGIFRLYLGENLSDSCNKFIKKKKKKLLRLYFLLPKLSPSPFACSCFSSSRFTYTVARQTLTSGEGFWIRFRRRGGNRTETYYPLKPSVPTLWKRRRRVKKNSVLSTGHTWNPSTTSSRRKSHSCPTPWNEHTGALLRLFRASCAYDDQR